MLALHVSDLIGPSPRAFCTSCTRRLWYVVIRVLLDTSSRYKVVRRTAVIFRSTLLFPGILISKERFMCHESHSYSWVSSVTNITYNMRTILRLAHGCRLMHTFRQKQTSSLNIKFSSRILLRFKFLMICITSM